MNLTATCYALNAKLKMLVGRRACVLVLSTTDRKSHGCLHQDVSDYNKLKKALLTKYNYIEDGYRKRFQEATPETEETPDQFVIRLKNYLVVGAFWKQS